MGKITEKIYNISAYFLVGTNFVLDFELLKSIILFSGAITLLVLQIRLHLIKIKREKEELDITKKNENNTTTEKPQSKQ